MTSAELTAGTQLRRGCDRARTSGAPWMALVSPFPEPGRRLPPVARPEPEYPVQVGPLAHRLSSSACVLTQSCLTLRDPTGCSPPRLPCPWDSPGKDTGVGCRALLQGIFRTQGWNLRLLQLLRGRRALHPLSHQGSRWTVAPTTPRGYLCTRPVPGVTWRWQPEAETGL